MDVNGIIHQFVLDEQKGEITIVVNEDASCRDAMEEKHYAIGPNCTYTRIPKHEEREIHGRQF